MVVIVHHCHSRKHFHLVIFVHWGQSFQLALVCSVGPLMVVIVHHCHSRKHFHLVIVVQRGQSFQLICKMVKQ
jgi:hypothetical protein